MADDSDNSDEQGKFSKNAAAATDAFIAKQKTKLAEENAAAEETQAENG